MKHISYTALLVGAAFALSIGAVTAQTFTSGDGYVTTGGNPNLNPYSAPNFPGAQAAPGIVPGYSPIVTPEILVGPEGLIPSTVAGAVGANGKPAVTYASEAPASAYASTATGNAGQYLTENGQILTASQVASLVTAGLTIDPTTGKLGGIVPSGTAWASPTSIDPNVKWSTINYGFETGATTSQTLASGGTVPAANATNTSAGITNPVLVTSTGALATSASQCTATAQCTYVASAARDPRATVASLPLTPVNYNSIAGGRTSSVTSVAGVTNSTTTAPGGAVYATTDTTGKVAAYTATGPGGVAVVDNKGNTTTVGASSISVVGPNGSVTIADPSITVTNGAGSTTTINNGNISNTGTLTTAGLASLNGGVLVNGGALINGGAAVAGGLSVTGGTTTDTLKVTNGATVAGGLGVTGGVTADSVTVAGKTTTGSLAVGGNASVGGGLTVKGPTALNGGATVTGGLSADSATAVVLSTQDSAGTVYGNVGNTLTSQQSQISALSSYTHKQVGLLSGGIATATAFESPQVDPGKKFGVALNWGEFNGYSGFAASGKFRLTDTWAATAGVGVDQNSNVSAKAGIQAQW